MFDWLKKTIGCSKQASEPRRDAFHAIIASQYERRVSEESKKAVAYCERAILEYEDWFDWNEKNWLFWQRVMIVGGVISTLAGAISFPESWLAWFPDHQAFGWLRSIPAAIVTIAAGYLASFTYREDAVRHELTASALWNELAKFQTRASPYNKSEDEDTSEFMNNVCKIIDNEGHGWSALVRSAATRERNH